MKIDLRNSEIQVSLRFIDLEEQICCEATDTEKMNGEKDDNGVTVTAVCQDPLNGSLDVTVVVTLSSGYTCASIFIETYASGGSQPTSPTSTEIPFNAPQQAFTIQVTPGHDRVKVWAKFETVLASSPASISPAGCSP